MRIRTVLLALVLALGGGALWAAPAHAATGLRFITRSAPAGSPASVVLNVGCPDGWSAVGGSFVVGGSDRVRVNAAVPGGDGYTVLAVEPLGGTGDTWQLTVTAACAPNAAVPGLVYVSAFSGYDSTAAHTATVECPGGRRLVGLGGLIDSDNIGQDRLTLTGIRPDGELKTMTATGHETAQGFMGVWRVKATAACANPIAGLSRISGPSAGADSASPKLARAACPAGTTVFSAGFDVFGADGGVGVPRALLDLDVNGQANRPGVETAAVEIGAGTSASWWLAAYGICAA